MAATVNLQPMLTSSAYGSFQFGTDGYIQGHALNEPSQQFQFDNGLLATTETYPMWDGCALTLAPGSAALNSNAISNIKTGSTVKKAVAGGSIDAFSIRNLNSSALQLPNSPVPLSVSGQSIVFARVGSGAKIPLGIDPAYAQTILANGAVNITAGWDYSAQQIIPSSTAQTGVTISSISWASNTMTITLAADAPNLSAGQWFTITGTTPNAYNGSWLVNAINHSTHVITVTATNLNPYNPITSNPGAVTTAGTVQSYGGSLALKVIEVVTANCLVIDYNYTSQSGSNIGNATYSKNGAIALVQI